LSITRSGSDWQGCQLPEKKSPAAFAHDRRKWPERGVAIARAEVCLRTALFYACAIYLGAKASGSAARQDI